ncbi:hypothetical protein CEK68_11725 [Xanthomonas sp. LMG 12461]|nr:hypothetical protein CEK68_11725 [Xanthomonas sp. LMG 12461]
MTTKEIWRVVPSVPELLASSEGRIMVIPYRKPLARGSGCRPYGGTPMRGAWDGVRYIYQFRGRNYKVARLVCEAFKGLPTEERNVCMHLDENARNNRPDNLEWGTQKENLNAPGFLRYCRSRLGDRSPFIIGKRKRTEA